MLGKCERRLWKQQEHGGYGIPEWLAGSKRVQVKGGMLLLAAYPWKTPTGKAVREIWLNTLEKAVERMVLDFWKVAGFWRNERDFVNTW